MRSSGATRWENEHCWSPEFADSWRGDRTMLTVMP
jgi:hypothetical protein